MSTNNEENVSTEAAQSSFPLVSDSLFNEKIAYGIWALKKLPEWPREKEEKIPLYRDLSQTIFLEITPRKIFNPYMPGCRERFILPHPLSFKRSVCVLQRDDVMEIHGAATTAVLNELVVDEKIKIIPISLLNEAIYQNDQDALQELAQLYDTHIGNRHHTAPVERVLKSVLSKEDKYLIQTIGHDKIHLQLALAKVAYCTNAAKNGYVTKVAHCCYTDAQVAENVRKALKTYQQVYKFGSLEEKTPTLVCLKVGNSEGVVIYASGGENEFQTKISKGIESQQLGKTVGNKRPANGEAPPVSAPKTKKSNPTYDDELPIYAENGNESNPTYDDELPIYAENGNESNPTNADELPISAPKKKKSNSIHAAELPISAPKKKKQTSTNAIEVPISAENGKEPNSTNAGELSISAPKKKKQTSTNAIKLPISAAKKKKQTSTNAIKLPISAPKKKKLNSTNAIKLPISAENGKESNSTNAGKQLISAPKKKKLNSTNTGKRPISAENGKRNRNNDAGRVMKAVSAAKEVPQESPKKPRRSKSNAMVFKMLNLPNDEASVFDM